MKIYLGGNIRYLRKLKGLSQEEFAGKIGCTKKTINYIELDYNYPMFLNFLKISELLDVSMDRLTHEDLRVSKFSRNPTKPLDVFHKRRLETYLKGKDVDIQPLIDYVENVS